MCNLDHGSFMYKLFEEIEKRIKLDEKFGKIEFGFIPPKIQHPSNIIIRMAIGTTYTKLRQSHNINFSENTIMDVESMSPKILAGIIIQMSMQLTKKINGLKPITKQSDFGNKKIYWNILDAVLGLFVDKLAEVASNKHFEEKMKSVENFIKLLQASPPKRENFN